MSDLIDKQAVIDLWDKYYPYISVKAAEFDCMLRALPSAQPEQRWIPCGKCIHADGKHRWCKILDRSINEDYFCYWAEPWKEGEANETD